ncbi:MAG: 30S ribosomal protein S2 [Alphaproteobacteria bacterium]|nr:30S ribosomal protein S2 [Alphaproteobacteria bacterium]
MTMPVVTLRQLFEAGVHFGHNTRRWNPKMQTHLFGVRNNVHIIDLEQTVPMMQRALQAMRDVAAAGGRVLFVGTKRQAQEKIAEAAKRSGQYYVNHRWLGGMLTNWKTISQSIKRLREYDDKLANQTSGGRLKKKEILRMTRSRDKLERALGGIKDMGGLPDIVFVIDTLKENIAIAEAAKLGVPVIAIVDSNSDPTGITYPIPGNDDAARAIDLYCDMAAQAVLDGLEAEMGGTDKDTGAAKAAAPADDVPVAASA